jgi:triosephosphate isomerase
MLRAVVAMQKKIIAGNWKMNVSRTEAQALLLAIKEGLRTLSDIEAIVFPSFVHLQLTETLLVDSLIGWGGQDLYPGQSGAFTGVVSGPMLTDYGCQYVLIGHSERRTLFNEEADLITRKFSAALESGLRPMLCIGETRQQHAAGETENVLTSQLEAVIQKLGIEAFRQAMIAYEPVWAIGTGLTAAPDQAQAAHVFIRGILGSYNTQIAKTVPILYGGSVKADNAAGLFAMSDIDGALAGSASLSAKDFLAICEAASKCISLF